jgi:Ca-activated chloride channel family protein
VRVPLRALLSAAFAVAGTSVFVAQQPVPPVPRETRPFRSGIDLTSITATVRDKDGHLDTDLRREAFEVFEDGEPQDVTQFTSGRVPISLGVLLDTSDSMFGKRIQDARIAVDRFLFELLAPDDEFFIMSFNHKPHILTTWTREPGVVRHALDLLQPSGATAIYDAVLTALPQIDRRARERAALLVLSDGADTASTATLREVTSALRHSDAFVYAIAIDSPDPQPINTQVNPSALRELTGESGGRTDIVHSSGELVTATADIAQELNSQYLLGYVSSHGADGQYHSIRVRVSGSEYRVRARTGYVATRRASPR